MATTKKSRRPVRAVEIGERLRKKYPAPRTALNWSTPLELLVATILSAQTTDAGVNRVTERLFKKYRTAADYAAATQAELEHDLLATGFYRQKAKNVIGTGRLLVERFGGRVPDSMDALLELPGVARKTANVVLGNAFGRAEGIAVDRHVIRVAGRLGLTDHTDPADIERDLMKLIPQPDWTDFSHRLIFHGREICHARKPECPVCPLNDICPSAGAVS
ncbi:MAG: endonuclease III [Phycisphaerae bacterium]|nr:endonuclease III [Phycisphaerae bacterium]